MSYRKIFFTIAIVFLFIYLPAILIGLVFLIGYLFGIKI